MVVVWWVSTTGYLTSGLGVGDTRFFSVQYDTEYFTFNTVKTILFSIPILNKSEASVQDKHVDNIHIHTNR